MPSDVWVGLLGSAAFVVWVFLPDSRHYRRWRGGRWARVTGFCWGRRWVRVGDECVERVEEDYRDA